MICGYYGVPQMSSDSVRRGGFYRHLDDDRDLVHSQREASCMRLRHRIALMQPKHQETPHHIQS
jgi:hypothetical protein